LQPAKATIGAVDLHCPAIKGFWKKCDNSAKKNFIFRKKITFGRRSTAKKISPEIHDLALVQPVQKHRFCQQDFAQAVNLALGKDFINRSIFRAPLYLVSVLGYLVCTNSRDCLTL
jgi:hypothetical protein